MQVQRQYALKKFFLKTEFENSMSFEDRVFVPSTIHQNCLDKLLLNILHRNRTKKQLPH